MGWYRNRVLGGASLPVLSGDLFWRLLLLGFVSFDLWVSEGMLRWVLGGYGNGFLFYWMNFVEVELEELFDQQGVHSMFVLYITVFEYSK